MCHTPHNRLHPTIRSINRPTARPPANSPLDRTHSPRLFDRKTLLSSTLHLRPDHTETPSLRPQHHISGAPYRLLHSCNAASLPPEAKPQHRTSGAPYRLLRIRSAASLRTPSLDLRNHDSTCRITPLNNRLRLLRLETTFPTTRHSLRRHRSPHNLRRKPIPKVSTRFP